ncbi:ABC transporter substrate-binding protein [Mesorhizobium sp.]|uniref:ABC transporter substrate-binding protein n=1 Tax=Mesorhizobium sp. TaxID=1871066 RepID=UPI000FE79F9D|nr:ABC transporter substrate-binding protein [Mesorhizobium sp.]RWI08728.1 MAG: ABC transporter substrate-binding protein [Mesorhizobium sp.]RWM45511.1 MAG: ABC transporter substrate-binding protein [Mesorhizobium sp.]RWM58169.1 MAG: ABC transporter substrate-binding protein [Mesorhizobium sp.]RWM58666.1 MAG: ABC transporter substrate-binding protein [Mesorhizobium sp.]RWM85641.1 MAG: ABC transporter substrate-binding protein [Mesorhizobium sp.]
MLRNCYNTGAGALACVIALALSLPAASQELTIVGAGGALQDAERKAFFEPFAEQFKVKVVEDTYTGEMAKVRAMVMANQVTWDVMQIDSTEMLRGCEEGLFEKLDWSKIANRDDFLPGATSDCGAGAFAWGFVTSYDKTKMAEGPKSWADFFDLKKFPGKRGVRATARLTLETALFADGVPASEVYQVLATPEGVDRAFAKLDEIKAETVFWGSGAESIERLVAGDVAITTTFNGRVTAANQKGKDLAIHWDGQIYGQDYWGIVKGSPRLELAEQFIKFASTPEIQKEFPKYITYGILNKKGIELVDPSLLADMPTAPENLKSATALSSEFWADYGEELEERFKAWQAK